MKNKITKVVISLKRRILIIFKNVNVFFSKAKSFWLLYLFSSLLFIGSTVLSIVGNNYTFDGKLENLSYQVARYAQDDEYETVSMNIEQNEINGEELVKEHNNYKYVNGFLSPQYRLNNCYIGINSNVSETFFLKYGDNDFSSKSIIFPNVFSSSEQKIKNEDGIEETYYKMDDMNLYYKFQKPQALGYGSNWCIVSSNYAEKIKNEFGLDSLEDVIGQKVNVMYSVLNEEKNENWTILGIYDCNLGDAKNLTQQYGDFILSWLIYTNYRDHMYYNINGLSLNYNLHYSIKNNNIVIKRGINKLNPTENKYTFLTTNPNDYGINNFLENSLLDVNNKRNYKFLNAYNICSIILYIALIAIVIITFFINGKKTNIGIEPFIFLILVLTICFGIIQLITLHLQSINYATSLVVYHGSQSLIVIYELILVYLLSIKLISYKFNKDKKVISND